MADRIEFYCPEMQDSSSKLSGVLMTATQADVMNEETNLTSSLCVDGMHRPALDIDIPMRVVPSSTEGHHHLYFDELALTWDKYKALLEALADAGIITHTYKQHSLNHGFSTLRKPGVKKEAADIFPDLDDLDGFEAF